MTVVPRGSLLRREFQRKLLLLDVERFPRPAFRIERLLAKPSKLNIPPSRIETFPAQIVRQINACPCRVIFL